MGVLSLYKLNAKQFSPKQNTKKNMIIFKEFSWNNKQHKKKVSIYFVGGVVINT